MIQKFNAAPLSSSVMLIAIFGFAFTLIFWAEFQTPWFGENIPYPNESIAFVLLLFFTILFIASLVSMQRAPVEQEILLDHYFDRERAKNVKIIIDRKGNVKEKKRWSLPVGKAGKSVKKTEKKPKKTGKN